MPAFALIRGLALARMLALLLAGTFAGGAFADPTETAQNVCAACHGAEGISESTTFPNLAAQQSAYIAKQLADFAGGKRTNPTMTAIVASVNSAEFEGLAAYYGALPRVADSTTSDVQITAIGRSLFDHGNAARDLPACKSCHLEHGQGDAAYPRLAGQHPDYTLRQLEAFKMGERKNDPHGYMRKIAQRLSAEEMSALAQYLAGM